MDALGFSQFYEQWLAEQDGNLQALLSAAAADPTPTQRQLQPLLDRVLNHYDHYYSTKSFFARRDVKPMFSPTWTSTTENLFLWVGGWRPTTAFHLLYSKLGLQVSAHLPDLIHSLPVPNLAGLSADQLEQMDALRSKTVTKEKQISHEEGTVQETVADPELVQLSCAITENHEGVEAMEPAMREKEEKMRRVLKRADKLRRKTLKKVVQILTPIQAVHFLIAAAELHLRVHEFGMAKDEAR